MPLRLGDLASVARWLQERFGLPDDLWTALPVIVTSRGRPEAAAQGEILGTMLVPDLCRVIADIGLLGRAAAEYVGVNPPPAWWDALALVSRPRLADVVAPGRFPLGRWPGPGRHPLTLLQQAAVNAIVERLDQRGLAAVNGPPGTGKTTLLRDLIANVLVERAALLAAIGDPDAAVRGGAAGLGFDPMDTAIVVASSNNAAVENVTTEVPLRSAIAEDLRHSGSAMDLFADVADLTLGVTADTPPEKRAWGLAAAKMGRSKNRSDFLRAFWFDRERSIRVRLKAASLLSDRSRWSAARERFASSYAKTEQLRDRRQADWEGERDIAAAAAQFRALEEADGRPLRARAALADARAALLAPRAPAPAWWQRLLLVHPAARRQRRDMAALGAAVHAAAAACPEKDAEVLRPRHVRRTVLAAHGLVTAPLWGESDEALRRASPWNEGELRRARDDLFVAAVALHREFILAAASAMRDELSLAVDVLNGKRGDGRRDPERALGFFFLVCPVVSTTFASMGRMFRELGRESIGWLLVDEAGQATPQAAMGAIWRARRAVVVGDPLQIPPVVSHPRSMAARVFGLFGQPSEGWTAPVDSAQTLADRRSPIGTVFGEGKRATRVGMPLLVHRRCEDPHFSLANAIAYDGQMILATPPGDSAIRRILGETRWIDVRSQSAGKWVEAEGGVVLEALQTLHAAGITDPDIYIISPFREVAFRLRDLIAATAGLLPGLSTDDRRRWARRRVGTVHTFQGKEAEAVIVVLGAGDGAAPGARRWAGETPNLLNVAATRAKRALYVVGNRELWSRAGVFATAAAALPTNPGPKHRGKIPVAGASSR